MLFWNIFYHLKLFDFHKLNQASPIIFSYVYLYVFASVLKYCFFSIFYRSKNVYNRRVYYAFLKPSYDSKNSGKSIVILFFHSFLILISIKIKKINLWFEKKFWYKTVINLQDLHLFLLLFVEKILTSFL